ncbi:MAG: flagellar hook-length control protein FliK [Spirochaetaceae bacterium]|nr:flagellar hook-length control protein FliK [Spirochaetaceae bacterium]
MIDALKTSDFLQGALFQTAGLNTPACQTDDFKPAASFAELLSSYSDRAAPAVQDNQTEAVQDSEKSKEDGEEDAAAAGALTAFAMEAAPEVKEAVPPAGAQDESALSDIAPTEQAAETAPADFGAVEADAAPPGARPSETARAEENFRPEGGAVKESVEEAPPPEAGTAFAAEGAEAEAVAIAEGTEAAEESGEAFSAAAADAENPGADKTEAKSGDGKQMENIAAHTRNDAQKNPETGEKSGGSDGKDERRTSKREKVKLSVRDFRTETAKAAGAESASASRQAVTASGKEVEIVVEVKSAQASPAAENAAGGTRSFQFRAERSLENFLARELHQNLNGDIVRHAQLMLKNGGEGTIRLSLRPETLGNVKIHLEMADNKVKGTIVVESAEALRAFEREISGMKEAFINSGFDGASLEMTLADGGGEKNGAGRGEAETLGTFNTGYSAARYDEAVETVDEGGSYFGSAYAGNSVDFLV